MLYEYHRNGYPLQLCSLLIQTFHSGFDFCTIVATSKGLRTFVGVCCEAWVIEPEQTIRTGRRRCYRHIHSIVKSFPIEQYVVVVLY